MPKQPRNKTKHPGVYYIDGDHKDKIFYIIYRNRDGKLIEEKAGRKSKDDMTAARAASLRGVRVNGEKSNKERRETKRKEAAAAAGRWTFDALMKLYNETNPTRKNIRDDTNRYDLHIGPVFGHKVPQDLLTLEIDHFRTTLEKKPKYTPVKNKPETPDSEPPIVDAKLLSPQTVKNILELVRRLANFGVIKALFPPPPFCVNMPAVDNLKTERMTKAQMKNFIRVCMNDKDQVVASLMLLALYTGARNESLRKLAWEDIDFENEVITLKVKGGRTEPIPMNGAALEVLLACQKKKGDSSFVFPGKKPDTHRVNTHRSAARIRDAAGLPKDFRPCHGLRHVFATDLASENVGDLTIGTLLTHSGKSGSVLVKRYAAVRDEAARKASEGMNRMAPSAVGQSSGD